MSEDAELEALRKRKLMELQRQLIQEQEKAEAQRRLEAQNKS